MKYISILFLLISSLGWGQNTVNVTLRNLTADQQVLLRSGADTYVTLENVNTFSVSLDDMAVCFDVAVSIDADINLAESVAWYSRGTGTFADNTIEDAVYTPSAQDTVNGTVYLRVVAVSGEETITDSLLVTFLPLPLVNAGIDGGIDSDEQFTTAPTSKWNCTQYLWTTSGTGTFSAATSAVTNYTPSVADVTAGTVNLTMRGSNSCSYDEDVLTLTITEVIPDAPTVSAGADTSLATVTSYFLWAGDSLHCDSINWYCATGTFNNHELIHPTFTPPSTGTYNIYIYGYLAAQRDTDMMVLTVDYYEADYYIATTGNDAWPGTYSQPFATWQKFADVAVAGDTCYVRGGVYQPTASAQIGVNLTRDGSAGSYINLWNYPGETPILDRGNCTNNGTPQCITMNGANYWYIKGIVVTNLVQTPARLVPMGINITSSNHIIVEQVTVHKIGYVGFQVTYSDDILFKNCDSYDFYDSCSTGSNADGGNADGWHISYIATGDTIELVKCRMWSASDDGLDCFNSDGVIIVDSCWAFRNGRGIGGGNGFKMGPHWTTPSKDTVRFVRNCLSFDNTGVGFTPNATRRVICFYNNIAYRNGAQGFQDFTDTIPNVYHNNIAYSTGTAQSIKATDINTYNSWTTPPGVTITDADFVSVDSTGVSGARGSDGSLPVLNFLKLAVGSDCIDAGTDVGLGYLGTHPDLGPFEKQ